MSQGVPKTVRLWLRLQCMSGILGARGPWTSPGVCWSVALAWRPGQGGCPVLDEVSWSLTFGWTRELGKIG